MTLTFEHDQDNVKMNEHGKYLVSSNVTQTDAHTGSIALPGSPKWSVMKLEDGLRSDARKLRSQVHIVFTRKLQLLNGKPYVLQNSRTAQSYHITG